MSRFAKWRVLAVYGGFWRLLAPRFFVRQGVYSLLRLF